MFWLKSSLYSNVPFSLIKVCGEIVSAACDKPEKARAAVIVSVVRDLILIYSSYVDGIVISAVFAV